MIELTNREWGTVILTALVVAGLLVWPQTRREVFPAARGVLRSLVTPKILISLGLYAVYVVGVVLLAASIDVWHLDLLKDTVIIAVFVGLPLFFRATSIKEEAAFAWEVIRDPIRVSALLLFYLNIAPLSIWAEVVVQGILGFLVLLRVVAIQDASTKWLARLLDVVVTLIVLGLVVGTALRLATEWAALPWGGIRDSFLLSIWFPVLLIPFIYVLALYAAYEQVVVMLPFFVDGRRTRLRTVLALIVGSRLRTAYASRVVGHWRREIAETSSFRAGLAVMRAMRADLRSRQAQYERDQARLTSMAGVAGVDEDGLQLARREFAATKRALTGLFFMEMGWHRNRLGHYRGDLVTFLSDINTRGLPQEHGIHEVVRDDKQAWRAWRETPSGYVFAVGGTRDVDAQWQYDGLTPPAGFPSERGGWRNTTREAGSAEWEAVEPTDRPPD